MRNLPLLAVLALAVAPGFALDIAGNVLDKLDNPIAGASVCIKSDSTSCVTTDADGAFHLSKAIAVRNPGAGTGFSLAYRRGSLIVRSPAAVAARVEWLSADGRHPWAAKDVKLSAGANTLALPSGLPHAGLCILRVSTADRILTWKAVLAPGLASASGAASSGAPRIASLAKTAAATLEISKSGYRTRTYDPAAETETDVIIYLSPTSDVGLTFGGTLSEKVVSIDHTRKIIITESTDAYCDSTTNSVVHETVQDTQNYTVRDGNLWTWYDGDCTGQMFSGTASDIVGTWNLIDANALLPGDLRTGCTSDTSASGESAFETLSAQYVISETQITGTISAESCPGDYFGYIFAYAFAADSTVSLSKNTCKQVEFTNGSGETATFDFTKQGDSLHTAYSYKTSSCAMDMYFGLSAKDPTCPEGQELAPFLTCMKGSGFAAMGPAAKVSANGGAPLPMSRARRATSALARIPKAGWFAPLRKAGFREGYISRLWKAATPGR